MYLKMNGKKDNIWLISLITSRRLRDIKRELESKTKKSKDNGAIIMISLISTFKTLPNSNFCFSDVKGFCCLSFVIKIKCKKILSRIHHQHYYMTVNIWKSYMCTAVEEENMEAILAVMNTTWVVVNIRPEK